MSLALRKATEELLASYQLSMFHTRIDPSSKNLSMVGPCGQVFTIIEGITFDSNRPTKADITYAAELFHKFLKENYADIREMLDKKAVLDSIPNLFLPDGGDDPTIPTLRYRGYSNLDLKLWEVVYMDGHMWVKLQHGQLISVSTLDKKPVTISQFTTYKPDLVKLGKAKKLLLSNAKRVKVQMELSDMRDKFNSCKMEF